MRVWGGCRAEFDHKRELKGGSVRPGDEEQEAAEAEAQDAAVVEEETQAEGS